MTEHPTLTTGPMGSLLPPSEVEGLPVVRTGERGKMRPQGRTKGQSKERVRVARWGERQAIYALMVRHAGEVLTYPDVASMLRLDRELVTHCVNTMFQHPDDYPHLVRVVRGTIRYDGPQRAPLEGACAPAGAAAPPLPLLLVPTPPTAAPAPTTELLLLALIRPVPGGTLAYDEETGVSWVVRRATTEDMRTP